MSAHESRSWQVTLHRTDIFVFRGVEATSSEGAVERARELVGQHDDIDFLDDRDESFNADREDE